MRFLLFLRFSAVFRAKVLAILCGGYIMGKNKAE